MATIILGGGFFHLLKFNWRTFYAYLMKKREATLQFKREMVLSPGLSPGPGRNTFEAAAVPDPGHLRGTDQEFLGESGPGSTNPTHGGDGYQAGRGEIASTAG